MNHAIKMLALALTCAVSAAQAAPATPAQARSWAAGCANCHGTNGQAQEGNVALAGLPKEVIIQKMQAYKAGQQTATIMHQLAKGYTDEQIEAIAGYFAAQKK
jgi:cytochrome c553